MIVYISRADTGVCPYDSYVSLKPQNVGGTPRGDPSPVAKMGLPLRSEMICLIDRSVKDHLNQTAKNHCLDITPGLL